MPADTVPIEVIVAGHVCLDVIPQLSGPADIAPGRLVNVGPASISTGGAVANTGIALHRLGVPVRLMGKVGDDVFGRAVLDALRAASPHLADGMIVAPGESTSYSIVISPPGTDRSFLHFPGANDTFGADDVRYDLFDGARLLHFGYPPIMRRIRADGGVQLREIFDRARSAGLATSLDLCQPDPESEAGRTDWPQFLSRVLPLTDVFLPSVEELMFMADRSASDCPSGTATSPPLLRRLSDRAMEMGATVVAIKLGEHGLYLRTTDASQRIAALCERLRLDPSAWVGRELLSPCFRAEQVVGTTGSGDCTIAGFLAALLRGESPSAAATSAVAVGAFSVEAADATSGVPTWPRVAARVAAGWKRWPVSINLEGAPSSRHDAHGNVILDGSSA